MRCTKERAVKKKRRKMSCRLIAKQRKHVALYDKPAEERAGEGKKDRENEKEKSKHATMKITHRRTAHTYDLKIIWFSRFHFFKYKKQKYNFIYYRSSIRRCCNVDDVRLLLLYISFISHSFTSKCTQHIHTHIEEERTERMIQKAKIICILTHSNVNKGKPNNFFSFFH